MKFHVNFQDIRECLGNNTDDIETEIHYRLSLLYNNAKYLEIYTKELYETIPNNINLDEIIKNHNDYNLKALDICRIIDITLLSSQNYTIQPKFGYIGSRQLLIIIEYILLTYIIALLITNENYDYNYDSIKAEELKIIDDLKYKSNKIIYIVSELEKHMAKSNTMINDKTPNIIESLIETLFSANCNNMQCQFIIPMSKYDHIFKNNYQLQQLINLVKDFSYFDIQSITHTYREIVKIINSESIVSNLMRNMINHYPIKNELTSSLSEIIDEHKMKNENKIQKILFEFQKGFISIVFAIFNHLRITI